jgi:type I restriction enzyme S subunit
MENAQLSIAHASSNDVPPGYKRTEAGVIPEEWGVALLSDLLSAGPKNGYSGPSGKEAHGTPTLSLTATSSGFIVLNDQTVKRLAETIDPRSDLFLKSGDVLVQRSNTLELVGTTAVFNRPSRTYVYPDLIMRLRFKEGVTAHWFWRYANSLGGRRFCVSIAAGSTGSMPKVSGEKLRQMRLPLPPLPEQRAITAALSDVDALITALEALIAKKRAIKQAAMQQLLTGKTRLPGFSGAWEVRRLTEITQIPVTDGPHLTPKFLQAGIPFLSVNNLVDNKINFSDLRYISLEDNVIFSKKCKPKKNDILLGKAASVGKVASNCSIIRGKTPVLNRSSVRVGHI